VNAGAWEKLPQIYQHAFRSAAIEADADMMAKYIR